MWRMDRMSNSSSASIRPILSGCSDESARTRARVLAGVAWECATLANEIAQLGAALSAERDFLDAPARIMQLQSFDRLTQSAHAQAQIVAHVAREILVGRPSTVSRMLD